MVMIDLDTLVPGDHLVRKLQKAIDWKRIQELALPLYSHLGRSGISPVVLFKLLMINFIFGHNSMRATCRECEVNMAYRWFLGINPSATIPNYSTWSQNYSRRYRGTGIKNGFIDPSSVFGDSTHQKACANKYKGEKEKCFAYSHSIFTDKNGFVLCVHTEPAICREIRHIIETKEIYKKRKCRKNLCRYERKQQA